MSLNYIVSCIIDADPSHDTIEKIIKNGAEIGFEYLKPEFGVLEENLTPLNIEDATLYVDNIINLQTKNLDTIPGLVIKYQGLYFNFSFYVKDARSLELVLGIIAYKKTKEFNNKKLHIDYAYYIKLMLSICDIFAINKLETVTE